MFLNSSPLKTARTERKKDTLLSINQQNGPCTALPWPSLRLCAALFKTSHIFSQKSLINNPTFCLPAYSFSKECEKCEKKNKTGEKDSIRSHSSLLQCCLWAMSFLHWWRGRRKKCSVLSWGMACCHAFIGLNVKRSCDMAVNALLCLTVHNSTRQR